MPGRRSTGDWIISKPASQARTAPRTTSQVARAPRGTPSAVPSHGRLARAARHEAFSYVELLVSLGIVGVLMALLLPAIGRSRASAQSVQCLAQLRQIGAGFIGYAADHEQRLPDPYMAEKSWEQLLGRYLASGDVFHCPGDKELYPLLGSSYDWRDTGTPETTLAGRLVTDSSRRDCVLAFEALPAWHARARMNAVRLDGAAISMDQEQCMADIQSAIRTVPREQGKLGKRQ